MVESDEIKTEKHFEKLEGNFNSILMFCNGEAKCVNAIFSTPTVLKKDFDYLSGEFKKELVMYRLVNPTIGEDDIFIARFSRVKNSNQITSSVKISSIMVLENPEMAKDKIKECVENLLVEKLKNQ